MSYPLPPSSTCVRRRAGFTLLEVMVALTVTLILMSLVVRIFQFVSDGVFAARANMELSDALRNAKHRLIADLRGTTALTVPPVEATMGTGYFEYAEGPVASGNGPDLGFRPSGSLGGVGTAPQVFTEYGDRDDMMMFTSLSLDEQFKGRVGTGRPFYGEKSRYAEIAWFPRVQEEYANAESRYMTLRRRAWLLAPWLSTSAGSGTVDISAYHVGGAGNPIAAPPTSRSFSTHFPGATPLNGAEYIANAEAIGNSLESLGWRQNRLFHAPRIPPYPLVSTTKGIITFTSSPTTMTFSPASVDFWTWSLPITSEGFQTTFDTVSLGIPTTTSPLSAGPGLSLGTETRQETSMTTTSGVRTGREQEDVVLNFVVGFDIKAWDPGAPVFRTTPDPLNPNVVSVLVPGDAGYVAAVERFISGPLTEANQPVSFGAYADLNYLGYQTIVTGNITGSNAPTTLYSAALDKYRNSLGASSLAPSRIPNPSFAGPGNPLSQLGPGAWSGYQATITGTAGNRFWTRPCTYDTWCSNYERDGGDSNIQTLTSIVPYIRAFYQRIDEGTNLIDDLMETPGITSATPTSLTPTNPLFNGLVDDCMERDAPPPYEAPLRGIKVTIRVMEPDSKQVREATVVHEFIPL